jgi:hypothetical protein
MPNITMELVYKVSPAASWLSLYGGYATPELRTAVLAAGWEGDKYPATPIDEKYIEEYTQTESFCQPTGSGLFGSPSEEEGTKAIANLRKALKPFGFKLGKARRQSWQEAI